jgi:hypothetical protein
MMPKKIKNKTGAINTSSAVDCPEILVNFLGLVSTDNRTNGVVSGIADCISDYTSSIICYAAACVAVDLISGALKAG